MLAVMMETFLENTASQLQDLHLALTHGDTHQAQALVQSVRCAAANLGAQSLKNAALRLEEACSQGDCGDRGTLIGTLDRELGRLKEAWGTVQT